MKKVLFIVVLLLLFTGCGKKENTIICEEKINDNLTTILNIIYDDDELIREYVTYVHKFDNASNAKEFYDSQSDDDKSNTIINGSTVNWVNEIEITDERKNDAKTFDERWNLLSNVTEYSCRKTITKEK